MTGRRQSYCLGITLVLLLAVTACGRRDVQATYVGDQETTSDTSSDPETDRLTGDDKGLSDPWEEPYDPGELDRQETVDPIVAEPDADTLAGTCTGMAGEGGCWHLAFEDQSCTDLCEDRGGYHNATNNVIGGRGSDAMCKKIAAALVGPVDDSTGELIWKTMKQQFLPFVPDIDVNPDYPFENKNVRQLFQGDEDDLEFAYSPGCTVHQGPNGDYAHVIRYSGFDTNPDDKGVGARRICSCRG